MNSQLNKVSASQAVSQIRSGQRVFIQGAVMTPNILINALCYRYGELKDLELFQIHTEGDARYTTAPYNEAFTTNSCFVGGNVRKAVNSNLGAYIPSF